MNGTYRRTLAALIMLISFGAIIVISWYIFVIGNALSFAHIGVITFFTGMFLYSCTLIFDVSPLPSLRDALAIVLHGYAVNDKSDKPGGNNDNNRAV